jgi:hypothetical protein
LGRQPLFPNPEENLLGEGKEKKEKDGQIVLWFENQQKKMMNRLINCKPLAKKGY